MVDFLSTPVILRGIFQNFSSAELLELSLVNKQWKHEARSLMKNRGDFTAHIPKNHTCQKLRDFACYVRRMKKKKKIIPFSGITITLEGSDHKYYCRKSSTGELSAEYEDILDQITWRNLAVTFHYDWNKFKDCTAYLLVEKIFKKYSRSLERLSLLVEGNRGGALEPVLPGCSFPNLKTFRLQDPRQSGLLLDDTREGDAKLIKTLISAASNLQVLYTEGIVDLQANLLEESTAVHVTDYEYYLSLPHEIPENGFVNLRMRKMTLNSICPQFNSERFNRMASTLLKSSRTTLSSIDIAAIFLVPLSRYRVCLQSVRTLLLRFSDAILERDPRLRTLVKSFDFKRIFPYLSTVQIFWMFDSDFEQTLKAFSDMIEQESATFSDPMPDRAANIEKLSLNSPTDIPDSTTQFLVQMFPDIQKLSIRAEETIQLTRIWGSWLDLTELEITLSGFRSIVNLDSAVCGIFPEEVAYLQEQDDEYLRSVNIVPVMPSITCSKGLRVFNLSFKELFSYSGRLDDPTHVLSKVTGFVAFQRCPALTVTLTTSNERRKRGGCPNSLVAVSYVCLK